MRQLLSAAALATLCLASSQASADVVFTYTGNPITTWGPWGPGPKAAGETLTLDFSDDGTRLLSWSAFQPDVGTINPSNASHDPYFGLGTNFDITTNATGQVISWAIHVDTELPWHRFYQGISSEWDGLGGYDSAAAALNTFLPFTTFYAFTSGDPGTWSSSGAIGDLNYDYHDPWPAGPIPEPQEWALCALGLMALIVASRRQQPDVGQAGRAACVDFGNQVLPLCSIAGLRTTLTWADLARRSREARRQKATPAPEAPLH